MSRFAGGRSTGPRSAQLPLHDDVDAKHPETGEMAEENILSKIVSFRLFTEDSYKELVEKEASDLAKANQRATRAQEVHLVDGELVFGADGDEEDKPPLTNPDFREGMALREEYGICPTAYFGKPLEEIDKGIRSKTFVVIAKKFRSKNVFRFSATRALYLLSPWSLVRRIAVYIATHQLFDMLIILTILINCVLLTMPDLSWAETAEYVFLAIYVLEMIIKLLARGFIINDYTYLRDPWNWLDFIVILLACITIIIQAADPSISVGNLAGLRTFRVLRALKTVSIVPGLKTIVNALLRAFKMLFEVIILTCFCLMVFALFALQIYMGTLRQKCVRNIDSYNATPSISYDQYYASWIRDSANWEVDDEGDYQLCGNSTGTGGCSINYTCLADIGENPNYGLTGFDHFGWSMLTSFQLLTLDFWEDTYNKVIRTNGPWNVVFFLIVIFFGAFYLLNLMLAVVAMSYEEEAINTGKVSSSGYQDKDRVSLAETVFNRGRRDIIILTDELAEMSDDVFEGRLVDRNCSCCRGSCCRCYVTWLRIENFIYTIVSDPLFDLFVTFCIVLNTVFLASEHYGMSYELELTLDIGNYIFSSVFILEAILKLCAMNKFYFKNGWNIFDLVIVVASIVDMGVENVEGLSVLRTFRLLRVVKLAQSWATMRILLTIIINTFSALSYLTIILILIIYIFAVMGLQLFKVDYEQYDFGDTEAVRWHFKDFYHSFMMIFRVLCGEWVEALWQCMRAADELCMVVFLPALIIGNFIVLNLFLALLINAFATDTIDKHKESVKEGKNLSQAFQRLKEIFCCCCPFGKKNTINPTKVKSSSDSPNPRINSIIPEEEGEGEDKDTKGDNKTGNKTVAANGVIDGGAPKANGMVQADAKVKKKAKAKKEVKDEPEAKVKDNVRISKKVDKTTDKVEEQVDDLELGDTAQTIQMDKEEEDTENEHVSEPPNCFPGWMRRRMYWLQSFNKSPGGKKWYTVRNFALQIVDNRFFEWTVLFVIFASSITLAFEDIYLYQKPRLQAALYIMNVLFCVLFTLEMVMKWIAYGFSHYFTRFWTILDFCIVVISIASLVGESLGVSNITAFRSLRTLRAMRPLRAISRWPGMRIVVNSLMRAIPAIFNVLLVGMMFWLIFSIMGVQFFSGKFYKCINSTTGEVFDASVIPNKNVCLSLGETWENSHVHFDNTAAAFLALFQVATFEGWMEVMQDAVDATEVDQQPSFEASKYSYIYFLVFIVVGSFFTLNLFISVIIDNFNVLKKKYEGSYLDAFLTEGQRNYYNTLKKLGNKKPQKTIKRPRYKSLKFFYNIAMSTKFELAVVLLIALNMMVMAVEHYRQTKAVGEALKMLNIIFTSVFVLEAFIKLLGLRWHYFRVPWNIFDFLIVLMSIMDIVLDDLLNSVIIKPTLLRVVRVFRIGRVLRLIKSAKGIRKLLFALIISLPAIFNIGALLFLVMYIYAIIGMSSFGDVKINGAMDDLTNFQTFGNSFLLLIRLATSAGWNDILDGLLIQTPHCNSSYKTLPDGNVDQSSFGDCGIPWLAIPFMVSYITVVFLIVINMYIAVILENFNQAHQQEEVGITEDDFDMFYVVWERYDPHATQFIKYEQLSDFVADLEQPMKIEKPNEITLVSFNLPIMEGDKLHCLDILMALIKNHLSDVEESSELKQLQKQMSEKFASVFPSREKLGVKSTTLQRKKEDVAAHTLQRAWRSHKTQMALKNITQLAMRQNTIRKNSAVAERRERLTGVRALGLRITSALADFFGSSRPSSAISHISAQTPPASPQTNSTHLQTLSRRGRLSNNLQVPRVTTLYSHGEDMATQDLEL